MVDSPPRLAHFQAPSPDLGPLWARLDSTALASEDATSETERPTVSCPPPNHIHHPASVALAGRFPSLPDTLASLTSWRPRPSSLLARQCSLPPVRRPSTRPDPSSCSKSRRRQRPPPTLSVRPAPSSPQSERRAAQPWPDLGRASGSLSQRVLPHSVGPRQVRNLSVSFPAGRRSYLPDGMLHSRRFACQSIASRRRGESDDAPGRRLERLSDGPRGRPRCGSTSLCA